MCVDMLCQLSNLVIPGIESNSSATKMFPTLKFNVYIFVSFFTLHEKLVFEGKTTSSLFSIIPKIETRGKVLNSIFDGDIH